MVKEMILSQCKRIFACSSSYPIQLQSLFLARECIKFASFYQTKHQLLDQNKKQQFHSTPILQKRKSRQIKRAHIKFKADRQKQEEDSRPDPISGIETPFTKSLLRPEQVYQAATDPSLPRPKHYFLDQSDENLLFHTMPKAAKELNSQQQQANRGDDVAEVKDEEEKAATLEKIVSLHNTNAKAISLYNVRQALKEFGRFEGDTGSPEVQAAVWTVRILNLHEHIKKNRKDKHNYRQLRMMVHKRQGMLKYLKRQDLGRYFDCLKRLGLDQKTIEGQIVI
ncbi:11661_t:CDS:2 [Ambispora gerdemannii]|uniref:11661_t:CDS:1 n=1 Tax=Ambispora gerdemannii TaxID=144530 RepID=A0A9N8W0C8_9GLOM|nr:11661_t:CDS:2 [Ambispora gerdemannii]